MRIKRGAACQTNSVFYNMNIIIQVRLLANGITLRRKEYVLPQYDVKMIFFDIVTVTYLEPIFKAGPCSAVKSPQYSFAASYFLLFTN